jgi:CBS domain-containing protein
VEDLPMKIRDVMTPNPRTVSLNDTVQRAAQVMKAEDVGAVPVVESGRVLAVVTDRDIVVRVVAEGGASTGPVRDVASTDVVTVSPDMSTKEAEALMSEQQIRRLMVVEGDRLVGVVSLGDLAVKSGHDQRVGETLEHISEGVKEHV